MRYSGRIFDGVNLWEKAEIEIDGPSGLIEYVEDTKNVDGKYKGLTFLPGLIDTHIHFFGTANYSLLDWVITSDVLLTIRSVHDAQRLLNAGFTTVRTMGDKVSLDMNKAEKAGILYSPRIISSGFSLAETGGNDDPKMLDLETAARVSYSYYCDGPWECRKAVRKNLRNGAESVKVYASTSFVGGGFIKDELTTEELQAISDEAHRVHLKAASHAYGASAIDNTIEGGFDSVEHGLGLTEEAAEKMLKRKMFYVPTLAVYNRERADVNPYRDEIIKRHLDKEIKLAFDSGVKIACGTDYVGSDNEPHGNNYIEAFLLSKYVGPLEALKSVTSVSAECLGRPELGSLSKGKVADMIAVRGDPTSDISLLKPENVVFVIKNGKVQKNELN
ncbi:MAG: amidohydrolase family protein [Thermoplasmata archaeon]